ncbi:succinate dehydrogenase [bacterium CG_4_9_14_3_um_filter_65_15]|nr:MAG: succinate dehydrogenase [bacterium CG_4_9_14_3_um_filter_65_15]
MLEGRERKPIDDWFGEAIPPGESRLVTLAVSESYSSMTVEIPLYLTRAVEPGPVVFVTAALHGDEINGTGAVRNLIMDEDLHLLRGAMILVPVLNILAFDRHSRYLPDRRDLNRSFPGTTSGSLASRMARIIFDEIVTRSDFGIDLHTAAIRRTNYPNVRADMSNDAVRRLALSFGAEIILDGKGPKGAFRPEACNAGCPTIIMEGGEIWKVEPVVVESALRGIKNVLRGLGMIEGPPVLPASQIVIETSKWMRAERGGFMQFHIQPGDIVVKDQLLATNTTLIGTERFKLFAPFDAVVIGMTSLPAVNPGEPICNLGKLPKGCDPVELIKLRSAAGGLGQRLLDDLATSVTVVEPSEEDELP